MGKAGTLRGEGSCCHTLPGPGVSPWWHPGLWKVNVWLVGFWKCKVPVEQGAVHSFLRKQNPGKLKMCLCRNL